MGTRLLYGDILPNFIGNYRFAMYTGSELFLVEYFAEIQLTNSSEAVKLFRERCLQIVKVKQNLPVIKKGILRDMVLKSLVYRIMSSGV